MPVKKTPSGGYKWGDKGKEYHGPQAKEKAARQGRAIKAQQAKKQKEGKKK